MFAPLLLALALVGPGSAVGGPTAPRPLPGALWAVEVDSGSLSLTSGSGLRRLTRGRVNALVVQQGSLTPKQLERLRRRARARGLSVFVPLRDSGSVPAVAGKCRALEVRSPGSRCAVWARSQASAQRLARTHVVDVTFARVAPGEVASLHSRHERIVGVPLLRGPPGSAWSSAARAARSSQSVDLGAAPRGERKERTLSGFLRLLGRFAERTDRRPPGAPRNLAAHETLTTAVALSWRPPRGRGAIRYGLYRNGMRFGSATAPSYTVSGLECAREYVLEVDAVDRFGNRSRKAALRVTTDECWRGGPPKPPRLFVATNGSDVNPCTRAAPCRSFDHAYQSARPGETVEVAGGSYPSQRLSAKVGASRPHVLIREAPGARVVLGSPGATVECIEFEGAQYVTLQGFETTYTKVGGRRHQCGITIGRGNAHHVTLVDVDAGMIWVGADDVTVLGGDFGPSIDENTKIEFGTFHAPRNIVIDGAVIHDQRGFEHHSECVALWGGSRVTIRNSLLYNCETFHLWIVANNSTISDVLIEGNTFTQPDGDLGIASTIKVGDHGGVLENIVVRGNKILVDEMHVLQGYEGGIGDIHVFFNKATEEISLANGESCMVDQTYTPLPGVLYECRRNRLVP